MSPQPSRHPAPLTVAQAKARYQAYARAAQRLADSVGVPAAHLSVPTHPDVGVIEGGAFVEARIWVPESEIHAELAEKGLKTEILG